MQITRGRVLAQRFFDIADEVDLHLAEALVTELSRRPRFVGSARHIQLPSPPLEMALAPRPCGIASVAACDVMVRIYDVGALAVTFVIDLPGPMDSEAIIAFAARVSEAEEAITAAARPVADEIANAIRKACKPNEVAVDIVEDYTIFYLQNTTPACNAATLPQQLDVPRLLLGDTGPIHDQERANLVHASFSYRPDDLVVVDWNSALVLDPTGALDVPELLELSSVQLLELRTYDELVGRSLDRLYDELETESNGLFRSSKYQRLSRRCMQLFVDVTEITERVDNSLKFLGDSWLARLHRATVLEFAIPRWQRQLHDKLEVLRQINQLLVDQITAQKAFGVEAMIVFLIIFEIILALFKIT